MARSPAVNFRRVVRFNSFLAWPEFGMRGIGRVIGSTVIDSSDATADHDRVIMDVTNAMEAHA
jgi:hypothetical protein